jgi:deazaflavin-dependent oxidoreductase (nitroreductase family)
VCNSIQPFFPREFALTQLDHREEDLDLMSSKAGKSVRRSLDVEFFRMLNRIVEPVVRAGVGSPRIVPGGFVVLETIGRKTGRMRRSPLAATRLGQYIIVATFRGTRSQWVLNLAAQPRTRYWFGGKPRETRAFVMYDGKRFRVPKALPRGMQRVVRILAPYTKAGWAFGVLSPR